jgi:predicted metalloprotease
MQILHQSPAHAAWDLRHAAAVEDLLNQYIKTLPLGASVPPPRLFIYKGTAFSRACPQSGIDAPAYCPGDHTIYLEMGLGDQVASKYGDFGALSILSHEFGHAYMSQRKLHPKGKEGELAADAFAGGFARYVEQKGHLDPGDVDEARATFAAVGDYEVYHHDHHGTPAERRQAFEQGYQQGFRLPGDAATPPTTTVPPAQAPGAPPTAEQNPPPPIAPLNNGASPVIPLLGLGMGGLLLVLIVVGVINMINRARVDD